MNSGSAPSRKRRGAAYASSVRKARPFALDDEMADVVGQLMLSPPADLRKFLISSRLPYPVMWLEADFEHGLRTRPAPRRRVAPTGSPRKPPERIGWLLTETPQGTIAVTRVARVEDPVSGESGEAMVYPATLLYSTEHKLPMDSHAFRSLEDTVHPDILDAIRAWNRTPLSQASSVGLGRQCHRAMDDPTFAAYRKPSRIRLCTRPASLLEPNMIARLLNPRPDETEPLKERAHSVADGGLQRSVRRSGLHRHGDRA
jgi:hypothetical protein